MEVRLAHDHPGPTGGGAHLSVRWWVDGSVRGGDSDSDSSLRGDRNPSERIPMVSCCELLESFYKRHKSEARICNCKLEDMTDNAEGESSANVDLVCALCDNGGEIVSCEGKCLRSFHAIRDAGEDCQTLGYTRRQFDVFPCASANCGYFYHAKCVAQLLFTENEAKALEYTTKIASGVKFACPLHKCDVCKYGENKDEKELQFAVCRRKIAFDDFVDNGVFHFQRAWEGLLPNNRILIFCLKHDIDPKLRTPTRDHIKFPDNPAVTRKPFDVNGMNKKVVKIRLLEDCPPAPLSSDKKSFGTVNRFSSSDVITKKRKVLVSGGTKHCALSAVAREKTSVPSFIPLSSFPVIDKSTERRIHEFAQKVSSDITIEDIQKKLVVPSTHTPVSKNTDKITLGMVQRSVEAINAALHMLENGSSIEDVKSVCAPSDLFQLARWKNKLNIYLAPFLHGMRYTSYGRHFTKLDKLEQIVDRLQWYIESGDTIMGLNPPFGFKASLANQFINKALTFKPKLIILIVPKETERLDRKYPPYELIWEDSHQLAGKSFYLPGSLDADNKIMEQWNMSPPPLSLWSRSDWARKHKEIAKTMGHISKNVWCLDDTQRSVVNTGHAQMANEGDDDLDNKERQEEAPLNASVIDQLLSDTYHDPTSSPGDYWTDTNGRSRQPCNYEGRNDPTHEYHAGMGCGSDMSISSSDKSDCEKQTETMSNSEHGHTGSEAHDHVGSAPVEQPTGFADCDEVTSAGIEYHSLENSPLTERPADAAGVQYKMLEVTPPPLDELVPGFSGQPIVSLPGGGRLSAGLQYQRLEDTLSRGTPEAGAGCRQLEDSLPAPPAASEVDAVVAKYLPQTTSDLPALPFVPAPRIPFPGLQFAPRNDLWQGWYPPPEFLSRGMDHPPFMHGSSGWLDD
uniref:Zinc finger PHD-type domain-containing protein n=1 Tax=Oryza rufipogon TaxID=4529 RepID=A0A0E0QKU2_ORYRU